MYINLLPKQLRKQSTGTYITTSQTSKNRVFENYFSTSILGRWAGGVGAGCPAACTAKKQHSSAARAEADLVKWGTVGKLRSLRSHLLCDIDRSASSFRYGSWRIQARSFEIAGIVVESIGFTVFVKFRGRPIDLLSS